MTMEISFCIDKKCVWLTKDDSYDCGYVCEFHTEKCPMEYECSHVNILEDETVKIHDVVMEIDTSTVGKVIEVNDTDNSFIVKYKDVKTSVKYTANEQKNFEIILRRVK